MADRQPMIESMRAVVRLCLNLVCILPLLCLAGCSGKDEIPSDPGGDSLPALSVSSPHAAEGNTILFNVTLSEQSSSQVIFGFATANITATAPEDYTSISGTDTVPANSLSVTLLVPTVDDSDVEPTEHFSLSLSSIIGATSGTTVGTASIIDNDTTVSFAADVRPLLQGKCAIHSCHGTGFSQGGLGMGTAEYDTIIEAKCGNTSIWLENNWSITDSLVVQAGNAAASTLYLKTTVDFPFPARMPSVPLSIAEQDIIRDWINEGAPDN
ncbi:MAG: hypothetical protein DRP45_05660 [Candidatus Zixiibacteriota bacterium]|nr:MAG: hypothetical protein DRP45_05660 [candidate division Zixibacteria bacterium]